MSYHGHFLSFDLAQCSSIGFCRLKSFAHDVEGSKTLEPGMATLSSLSLPKLYSD